MPPRPTTPSLFPADALEPTPAARPRPASHPANAAWIHAHCDGGARGNPGPAGYGALLQDEEGRVLAELSEFLGMRTNNFAEYTGLLGCLQYALDHNYPRLKVVSDSELMVKQIQGKYQVKSPDLKPLFDEAKRRIARLDGFEIAHALRHKNKEADRLANEAMDRGMKRPGVTGQVQATAAKPSLHPAKTEAHSAKLEVPPIPISFGSRLNAATSVIVPPAPPADTMLRGFTRDGVVHILGGTTLPDGIFVKIIRE